MSNLAALTSSLWFVEQLKITTPLCKKIRELMVIEHFSALFSSGRNMIEELNVKARTSRFNTLKHFRNAKVFM